jgi:hypothetical protein
VQKDSIALAIESAPDEIGGKLMKRSYTPALAIGIGMVAGLRALTAPAVLAWAAERRLIRLGRSPLAKVCQLFCVNERVLVFGMGARGKGQHPFPRPAI